MERDSAEGGPTTIQPPLMAGTIEISVPGDMGVASPPEYRKSSFPTKTLMCSRICPCSVTTRSRMPGHATHSACKASASVAADASSSTWLWPSAKERSGPGM